MFYRSLVCLFHHFSVCPQRNPTGFKPRDACHQQMSVTVLHFVCLWCLERCLDSALCAECKAMNPKAICEQAMKLLAAHHVIPHHSRSRLHGRPWHCSQSSSRQSLSHSRSSQVSTIRSCPSALQLLLIAPLLRTMRENDATNPDVVRRWFLCSVHRKLGPLCTCPIFLEPERPASNSEIFIRSQASFLGSQPPLAHLRVPWVLEGLRLGLCWQVHPRC